ncbi:ABC transporter substrate-binding protein [Citroniella saccharovorans]|uniref:ABC transporter substrate-binding protein n=1 Tax=Citroniella saccharovorans TaxID=2053367 RepID=A0AAW9MWR1_9FIRM|nr:ABC transporter substrate-binding protein [Citroniella saccharovorans]MEB3429358.1 ABC transporter substrate-binding protein [Citroniella saccharovorans]
MKKRILVLFLLFVLAFTACTNDKKTIEEGSSTISTEFDIKEKSDGNKEDKKDNSNKDISSMSFEEIKEKAKGTTVNFYGYGGDVLRNDFIDKTFIPYVKENYDVTVNRVPMDIDAINNLLLNEKQAGKDSVIDVVWINGENFYSNKEAGLLFGPFTDKLDNFKKYVDEKSDDVNYDFAYPIEGYEAPYGKAQHVLIYDSEKVPNPPKSMEELKAWVKENPGKFTYPQMPDFTASAFFRNVISEIVGYEQFMDFDKEYKKEDVLKEIDPAIAYLNEIEPYLWNEGKTYPKDLGTLNNMFKDGEVWMTMSYNPSAADVEIAKGAYKDSVRTFVFNSGNIGNTHFLAIPLGSTNKEGAIMMIDAMLSFEMQLEKSKPKVLGDMPVFDINKLSDEEKKELEAIDNGVATLPAKELLSKRIPEMPAKLVPLFEELWNENVLNK